MAWTNFVITLGTFAQISSVKGGQCTKLMTRLAGLVGSVAYLMKSDVRRGSTMFKQNLKTIRGWLEEEGSQATR